jgi:hypothetical protein
MPPFVNGDRYKPRNDLGDLVELLDKQMLWIYLWRTIYPLKSTSGVPERKITTAVNRGFLV